MGDATTKADVSASTQAVGTYPVVSIPSRHSFHCSDFLKPMGLFSNLQVMANLGFACVVLGKLASILSCLPS